MFTNRVFFIHDVIIKILNLLQILLYSQTKPEEGLQRMNLCQNILLKEFYQIAVTLQNIANSAKTQRPEN